VKWYTLAVEQGEPLSAKKLDKILKETDPIAWEEKQQQLAAKREQENQRIENEQRRIRENAAREQQRLSSDRKRERQMRRLKTAGQAQRFLTVHGAVENLFRRGRHVIRATHYCEFRSRAFSKWQQVTCA
jgi:hypothetical protein